MLMDELSIWSHTTSERIVWRGFSPTAERVAPIDISGLPRGILNKRHFF